MFVKNFNNKIIAKIKHFRKIKKKIAQKKIAPNLKNYRNIC